MANDIKIIWDNNLMSGDIEFDNGDLTIDNGLETAVIISLHSDRRASDDDILPDDRSNDRRGWWGDQVSDVADDEVGSKLYLLERSKTTQSTLIETEIYIRDCLQWMIDDEVIISIDVEVERQDQPDKSATLAHKVILHESDGKETAFKFHDLWVNQIAV